MKRQFFLFLMALLSLVANADSVEIDGIYYNLNYEEGVAEVTGKSNKYSTDIVIPASVTYNNIVYDVTGIGDSAFMGCKDLTSVDISDNVVKIGDQAFYGCSGLTSVTIPNSVVSIAQGAFSNCTSLTSVFIPQNVTRIGNAAFYKCTSLASVTISNSVINIGEWAFRECTSLTSITIPESVTSIGEWAFDECKNLTSIQVNSGNAKYDSRENCNAIIETRTNTLLLGCLKTVIPNSIVNIGEWAFNMCSGLTSITIPNSVLNIGKRAFNCCYNLNTITIPEGIKKVSDFTFNGCKGLKTIIIPSSVTSFGSDAFNGCESITDIYCYADQVPSADGNVFDPFIRYATLHVPSSAIENYKADWTWSNFGSIVPLEGEIEDDTYINGIYYSFSGSDAEIVRVKNSYSGAMVIPESITYLGKTYKVTSIGKDAFGGCRDLTSITIPNSVTKIEENAFISCSGLTSITIPNSVTTIGVDAFYNCTSLTSVNIPNSVTNIGDGAFSDCTDLTSVIIPKSVTSINGGLFSGCTSLTSVILPQSVLSIGSSAFYNCCNLASITIPDGVTSIGSRVFGACTKLTSITIPNSVTTIGSSAFADCSSLTSVIIGDGLTNIGTEAFRNCSSLTSVNIPKTLTDIEEGVFRSCVSLQSITIPNNVIRIRKAVFQGCENLTSITIPEKVSGIGESTFSGCSSLTEIHLPSGITRIGDYAFSGCESLTSITFPNALKYIGYGAFRNCASIERLTIPESVTSIGNNSFMGCTGLTEIIMGNGITSISNAAFRNCKSLIHFTISENVTSIEDYALMDCTGLTEITIPQGVTKIGEKAFYGCTGLTSITIPENVTNIGTESFGNCNNLNSILVKNNNDVYDSRDNCNAIIKTRTNTLMKGCAKTIIPNSVTNIDEKAFWGCSGLTSIIIPSSVCTIGDYAFSHSGLTTIRIPDSVTSINNGLCYGCSGLTSVTIPNSVTSINNSPFTGCKNLTDVYCYAKVVPTTTNNSFNSSDIEFIKLYVPASALEKYRSTSPWNLFGEIRRLNIPILKYIIDEEVYAEYEIEKGSHITPEPNPTKEGYTFSGWSEIPDTMPDNDVIITGSFSINKYKLTYIIDGDVYKTYEIEYNAPIIPESAPIKKGMTLLGWEEVPDSMPAHDVTLSGTYIWFQNKIDNIIYQVTDTLNNYASVIGCDKACEEAKILSSVEMGECEYRVDSISKNAFWYCTLLSSINIPEGLTSIGERAFYGCYRMKDVTIPNSVIAIGTEAFGGCESLTSICLSNSLQRIEKGTFWKCKSLASIIVPGSVISIGNSVFSGCSSLQSVTIGNGVTTIGNDAFEFCHNLTSVTFPSSILNIGSDAFYECNNLKSIHISDVGAWCKISFDDQSSNPFYYGGKLYLDDREVNDLIIPGSVTVVKRLAFCGCASLTSINIPNSVDSIGHNAFAFCNNLTDVFCYGLQVPNVDDDAFKGSYIQTLYVPKASLESYKSTAPWSNFGSIVPLEGESEDDTYIDGIYYDFSDNDAKVVKGENAYSGDVVIPASVIYKGKTFSVTSIGDFAFFQCNGLTSVSIPESITTIGQLAFATCSGLISINLPDSVTSIGVGAFAECTGLTLVSLPEGFTSISESLFSGCNNLTSITIPKNITIIGERAFAYCSKLKNVYSYAEQVPSTTDNAFENTPIQSAVLQVPTSSAKELYKTTAPWSGFGTIIAQTGEEVSEDGPQLENSSFDEWHVVGSGNQALYNPWKEGGTSYWDTGNKGATTVGASNSTYGIEDGRTYANLQSKFIVIKFAAGNIFTGSYLKTDGSNGILSLGRPFNGYPSKLQFDYTYKSSIVNRGGNKWDEKYSRYISQQTYDEMRGKPDSCCIWVALIGDKDEEVYDGVTYPFIIRTRPSELHLFDSNSDNVIAYGQFTSGDDQLEWGTRTIDIQYRNDRTPKYIIVVATSSKYGDYFVGGDASLLKLDNLKLLYDDPIPIEKETFFAELANGVQMEFGYISKDNRTCQVGSGTRPCISTETSGGVDIPSEVEGYTVVAVSEKAFDDCSGLTSVTIPNGVASIGSSAFQGCRLRNVLLRSTTPASIDEDAFSKNIYNHSILYIPNGSWGEYVFNSNWYQFINIRETTIEEEQLSMQQTYTLMDANTFAYSVYDPVNDCIGTISSEGINEDNPNHCWQVIEAGENSYLYNLGAKKYAASFGNSLNLTNDVTAIEMGNGKNGITLGKQEGNQWAFVSNEHMNVEQSIVDSIIAMQGTSFSRKTGADIYDLQGRKLSIFQKGINIIRMSDGTTRKVMIK